MTQMIPSNSSALQGGQSIFGGRPTDPAYDYAGDGLPAQVRPGMQLGGGKRRRAGILHMAAGSQHVIALKATQREPVAREKLAALKKDTRDCQSRERNAQEAQINEPSQASAQAYLSAQQATASAIRTLNAAQARGGQDPVAIHVLTAQDPSTVPEAFTNPAHPPQWVCTHDGCKSARWATERDLRRDHPSQDSMLASNAIHCVGILSEAPADSTDPMGPTIGLVAPVGVDGLTAAQVATMALGGERMPEHATDLPEPQDIPAPSTAAARPKTKQ